MNKITSIPIVQSDLLTEADEPEEDYASIKLISQEIIEEKEEIIQQIYKQLKDSIRTIDLLTNQLEFYKKNQPQQISLRQLKEKGFLRKQGERYFCLIDVTKALQKNRQSIKLDFNVQIIHQALSDTFQRKINMLQSRYSRAMEQCEQLLKALTQKEEKEEITVKEIEQLKEKEKQQEQSISRLMQEKQILERGQKQLKKQHQFQKSQLINERQQLCLQLSELKRFTNKETERIKQIYQQNEELKQALQLLEQKIKGFQLQQMERDFVQSDRIRSYKQSIVYADFQAQYPEKNQIAFDKQNKLNLANLQTKSSKQNEKLESNSAKVDKSPPKHQNEKKASKDLFKVISFEGSNSSSPISPNKQLFIEVKDKQIFYDTFPQANTAQRIQLAEEKQLKLEQIPHEVKDKIKLKGKKQRKVIRINF